MHVLIVPGRPNDLATTLRELPNEYPGARVTEIADGQGLAEAMQAADVDLVITEFALDWSDGLSVFRAVKSRWPDVPVIMYTATGNEEVAVEAMKAGLDDYVPKSAGHVERLASAVARALNRGAEQRALQLAEQRYQDLFERVPVGLYRYDPNGTLIECNQAMLDIFLAPDLQALRDAGFPSGLYVDPADREAWRSSMLKSERVYGYEYRVHRLDGRIAWVRHSAQLVKDDQGDPRWFEGVLEDVTPSRQAHEARREAEHRYRDVFDNVPVGLYRSTPDGTLLDANPALLQILGYERLDDYLAARAPDLYVDPEDRLRWQGVIERESLVRGFEFRIRRPNGTVIWVRNSASTTRDETGRTIRYDGYLEDVSDRRRAEEEIALRAAQHAAIAELGRTAVSDASLAQILDTACRLVADTLDVDIASVLELLPEQDRFVVRAGVGWPPGVVGVAIIERAGTRAGFTMDSGEPFVVGDFESERRFVPSRMLVDEGIKSAAAVPIGVGSGAYGVLSANSRALRGFSADDVTFLNAIGSVLAEVTRRRRAEDDLRQTLRQLRELNEERRRLLARLVVAQEEERQRIAGDIHDDPIQVMAAAAVRLDMMEGVGLGPQDREMIGRAAETVQQAIDRLRHLVFELRPPALDREGLAVAVQDYLDRMADSGGLAVVLHDEISHEPSRETRTAVFRIVQEALTNVRKHAEANRVEVFLERRDGGVAARIADDGIGFRLERELNRSRPGHLGLQSMSERAEALGGWCHIRSGPGEGSTVDLWLPDGDANDPFANMSAGSGQAGADPDDTRIP
jgi:PAS domain S-box-containing protein